MSRLAILFFISGLASAASKVECMTYESLQREKPVRYCIHQTNVDNRVENQPVIYFFHGMGGGAGSWQDGKYEEALNKLAQEEFPGKSVTAVSFDTHPQSFFSDWGGVGQGSLGFESWFLREFMPMIEREYRVCNEKKCRLGVGVSMGGFGVLKTALKSDGELFSAVAANCPALSPFEVYDTNENWRKYFGRHPIGSFGGMLIIGVLRQIFPNRDLANANDPTYLINHWNTQKAAPALYFDVGGKDFFGLQEGYAALKKALEDKRIAFESHLEPDEDHNLYLRRNINALRFVLKSLPNS